jgi:hypothetical protein
MPVIGFDRHAFVIVDLEGADTQLLHVLALAFAKGVEKPPQDDHPGSNASQPFHGGPGEFRDRKVPGHFVQTRLRSGASSDEAP